MISSEVNFMIQSHGMRVFLRSMLFTACAIALLVIGFFSAGYFFG